MAEIVDPIQIDFNIPTLVGKELEYISQAFARRHTSGDGHFSKACQSLLEQTLGVKKALLTTSCTHALEMAALLVDVQPGDEIIVPSFTFVSTVNAFVLRGAQPVFIDIRPDTLNMDERLLEGLITPRTRAVVPVHYAGVACEMDAIQEIATRHNIGIVEDNAHGLFGKYKGSYLGTFGCMATQSFHETKNISCGEGGALLINDPNLIERAEIVREKGTNRSRFFRGMVDKYTWVDVGSSYLSSDILAAVLFAQLEARQHIQLERQQVWDYYDRYLRPWAPTQGVQVPTVPAYCEQSYHMYYLILPSLEVRQRLIGHLRDRGIISVFHYQALHLSDMGQRFGGKAGDCPVTESVSDRLLRLPFHNVLTPDKQDLVIQALHDFDW
jgi:dTDP-4-amino-4,6-dideoxygalactose transaminase